VIQFYSNNATNLHYLTTHSAMVLPHKMAILLRPQMCDVTSPYVLCRERQAELMGVESLNVFTPMGVYDCWVSIQQADAVWQTENRGPSRQLQAAEAWYESLAVASETDRQRWWQRAALDCWRTWWSPLPPTSPSECTYKQTWTS